MYGFDFIYAKNIVAWGPKQLGYEQPIPKRKVKVAATLQQ